MSTKAQVQAVINAIADGQPNTASEARDAWNILLNELYPTVYFSWWAVPIKTQSVVTGLKYFISFYKKGNTVFVNGHLERSIYTPANTDLFVFTDTEFYNLNNGSTILDFTIEQNGYVFTMTDGVFKAVTPIPAGTTVRFNFSYPTNP